MAYNRLSLRVNKLELNYANFIDEFTTILHRHICKIIKCIKILRTDG